MTPPPGAAVAAAPRTGTQPPPGATARREADRPRRAAGLELLGRFDDSGFKEPPHLVRRADGQVVQLPPLLYAAVEAADGTRDHAAIGDAMSATLGRTVTADNVRTIVDRKLRPAGLLAGADGSEPQVVKHTPLLALKHQRTLIPAKGMRVLGALFAPLLAGPVVLVVLGLLVALDAWLYFSHGVAPGAHDAFYNPVFLLLIFGATIVGTAFHEIGHAAACRYGGARPGRMGAALYVVWPAFYCDVTDSYRLGRGGRVRTDLGGVYFNAIFALLAAGAYFLTGREALLLIVSTMHVIIVQQLLPLLRFDGYYVLSDLTGVPDILQRVGPILRSLDPRRPNEPAVDALKPWVRWAVTGYLAVVVPLAVAVMAWLLHSLPRLLATVIDSLGNQVAAVDDGGVANAALHVLQMGALLLPAVAMTLTSVRLTRAFVRSAWAWANRSTRRRVLSSVASVVTLTVLLMAWGGEYEPIRADDRATLPPPLVGSTQPVVTQVAGWISGTGGEQRTVVVPGERLTAPGVAAPAAPAQEQAPVAGEEAETPGAPAQGRSSSDTGTTTSGAAPATTPQAPATTQQQAPAPAPAPPAPAPAEPAPEVDDGPYSTERKNEALAYNPTDGSRMVEMAFALALVQEGDVDQMNVARAIARCTACRTIAIAVQVVLASSDVDVVAPLNFAEAINFECQQCETLAYAIQIVLQLDGSIRFSKEARDEMEAIRAAMDALARSDLPLADIEAALDALADRLRETVRDGLVRVNDDGTVERVTLTQAVTESAERAAEAVREQQAGGGDGGDEPSTGSTTSSEPSGTTTSTTTTPTTTSTTPAPTTTSTTPTTTSTTPAPTTTSTTPTETTPTETTPTETTPTTTQTAPAPTETTPTTTTTTTEPRATETTEPAPAPTETTAPAP